MRWGPAATLSKLLSAAGGSLKRFEADYVCLKGTKDPNKSLVSRFIYSMNLSATPCLLSYSLLKKLNGCTITLGLSSSPAETSSVSVGFVSSAPSGLIYILSRSLYWRNFHKKYEKPTPKQSTTSSKHSVSTKISWSWPEKGDSYSYSFMACCLSLS